MIITGIDGVPTGVYDGFKTWLLIGEKNAGAAEISIQLTRVEPGGEQFIHSHPEEQCYYIVSGLGLMTVVDEKEEARAGQAVLIQGFASHGIRNTGAEPLVYLTANKIFGHERESRIWPMEEG